MNTQRAFVHQLNGLALVAGLLLAGACAGPVTESGAPEESRPTPNIVFILVDDLRWDDIGAAGHPFVETPNIDRLAAEGAMFSNAFATTPLCSPSRASFLLPISMRMRTASSTMSSGVPRVMRCGRFPRRSRAPATRRRSSASGIWAVTTRRDPASTTGCRCRAKARCSTSSWRAATRQAGTRARARGLRCATRSGHGHAG